MRLTREAESRLTSAFAKALSAEAVSPEDRFEGRGILVCAGGPRLFTCAWVLIGRLRQLGCRLPIQLWYLGPEELGPPMRALLSEFAVETVDALEVAKRRPAPDLGGWELKSFALVNCRFREVLLLDADNVPASDPEFLFDDEQFRIVGALFWPDSVGLAATNPIWSVTGVSPWTGPSFESGQILIDKAKCWRPLLLANWMNSRSDLFYSMIYGDKDTFLVAWLACDAPFHQITRPPARLHRTFGQHAPDGRRLFLHRTDAKWTLSGDNPKVDGFEGEDACIDLLVGLSRVWDGTVFNPPAQSSAALRCEAQLIDIGKFRLVHIGLGERVVELLPSNRLGRGAGPDAVYWHVEDDEACPWLVLSRGGGASARLSAAGDGRWVGRQMDGPRVPVVLAAEERSVRQGKQSPEPSVLALAGLVLAHLEAQSVDNEIARDYLGAARALLGAAPEFRSLIQARARDAGTPPAARLALLKALSEVGSSGVRSDLAGSLRGPAIGDLDYRVL